MIEITKNSLREKNNGRKTLKKHVPRKNYLSQQNLDTKRFKR